MNPIAKRSDCFTETTLDDEVVVMHVASGEFYSFTHSARAIWESIDGQRNRAELIADLAAEYDEPPARIAPEIDDFLARLRDAGLIGPD